MSPTDVQQLLLDAAASGQQLELINTYRGIPIVHPITVRSSEQGYLVVDVHPHQVTCLALEGKTYIRHPLLSEAYLAQAVAVDVVRCQAVLAGFTPAGETLGRRVEARVQPHLPIETQLLDGERRIPGRLVDISASGAGIFTLATFIYGDVQIAKDSPVFLDFRLPDVEQVLRFKGKIASLIRDKHSMMHRVGLDLEPNSTADELLRAYVEQRQVALLAELQRVYESMVSPR